MQCCASSAAVEYAGSLELSPVEKEAIAACHEGRNGMADLVLVVPDISCGGCISKVERHLGAMEGVASARVNLTLKRLQLQLENAERAPEVLRALAEIGYPGHPVEDMQAEEAAEDAKMQHLVRSLAVAGFATGNIMLLSVSVWSGASGPTRDLFHLVSGLIAIPAAAYAGQVFYRSAFAALRRGQLNMDVPITLAILLALAMSLYETLRGGPEAYFDAAAMLLFFLLIGRTLDQMMRNRAQTAVKGLARLAAKGAEVLGPNGPVYTALDEIAPGMVLVIPPGGRIPVDGVVVEGVSDLDRALVTGEAEPVAIGLGAEVEAGTLNLTGPLKIRTERAAEASFLAEVMRMMEVAETGRGRYRRVADRMAQIYAPAVHLLAAITFVGWFVMGGDWHIALTTAIAVLIVTCPCALGLAVPVTHVIAAGRLFEAGTLMKDGSALERMAEIDIAVFDKTGTMTTGTPAIEGAEGLRPEWKGPAAALARASTHPAARALAAHLIAADTVALENIREVPGSGIEARRGDALMRLGRAAWVQEIASGDAPEGLAFAEEGQPAAGFEFSETLREGAEDAMHALAAEGLERGLLSGDTVENVERISAKLSLDWYWADHRPADKVAQLGTLAEAGHKVLMVGDGLNDGPALRAAHVSMAPSTASDVGRMAADFVFTRPSLASVPQTHRLACAAGRIVRQNFGLALAYNTIAVPLAIAGFVTPLVAAIAMSASSVVVVCNSLRLRRFPLELEVSAGAQTDTHINLTEKASA